MRVLGRLGVPFGFVTSMGANGELKNLSPLPTPNVQYFVCLIDAVGGSVLKWVLYAFLSGVDFRKVSWLQTHFLLLLLC